MRAILLDSVQYHRIVLAGAIEEKFISSTCIRLVIFPDSDGSSEFGQSCSPRLVLQSLFISDTARPGGTVQRSDFNVTNSILNDLLWHSFAFGIHVFTGVRQGTVSWIGQ